MSNGVLLTGTSRNAALLTTSCFRPRERFLPDLRRGRLAGRVRIRSFKFPSKDQGVGILPTPIQRKIVENVLCKDHGGLLSKTLTGLGFREFPPSVELDIKSLFRGEAQEALDVCVVGQESSFALKLDMLGETLPDLGEAAMLSAFRTHTEADFAVMSALAEAVPESTARPFACLPWQTDYGRTALYTQELKDARFVGLVPVYRQATNEFYFASNFFNFFTS